MWVFQLGVWVIAGVFSWWSGGALLGSEGTDVASGSCLLCGWLAVCGWLVAVGGGVQRACVWSLVAGGFVVRTLRTAQWTRASLWSSF